MRETTGGGEGDRRETDYRRKTGQGEEDFSTIQSSPVIDCLRGQG